MRYSILAVLLLTLAGCGGGGDRLDASNEDAMKASMAKMKEKMTADQKAQFTTDCATMTAVKAADFHGKRKPGPPDPTLLMKDMDGLTAAQIHEMAEAARAEAKSLKDAAAAKRR